jgi:hypothetical protein
MRMWLRSSRPGSCKCFDKSVDITCVVVRGERDPNACATYAAHNIMTTKTFYNCLHAPEDGDVTPVELVRSKRLDLPWAVGCNAILGPANRNETESFRRSLVLCHGRRHPRSRPYVRTLRGRSVLTATNSYDRDNSAVDWDGSARVCFQKALRPTVYAIQNAPAAMCVPSFPMREW